MAVRALSEASVADGDFVLTGPAALSHARQVAVIGEVLGRGLAFHELSPDDFRRETAATWPPSAVEMLLAAWGAAVGHPAYVTTTVADLTGGDRAKARARDHPERGVVWTERAEIVAVPESSTVSLAPWVTAESGGVVVGGAW